MAHLACRHRTGARCARLAPRADGTAGVIRRRHLRHRIHFHDARARRGPRGRRARCARSRALGGRDLPSYRVYCSEQAHSSVDKAVIAIGLGHQSLRRITTDSAFCLDVDALAQAIATDRSAGIAPLAVVATIGTTSTTSVDPLAAIADVCERERVWLHVDAAYAGVAALLPSHRHILAGVDRADSLVVNPHKWLFTPFDLSVVLLPAHGRHSRRLRAHTGVPDDHRPGVVPQPDGHRRPARTAVPGVEAVDDSSLASARVGSGS